MLDIPLLLIVIVFVALVFDFTNGAHDCANAIATVVATKALTPRTAVLMAASLNLVGALLGSEVAYTLGKGIVNPEVVMGSRILVLAALFGAIAWNIITWYYGLPSSSSHALIGGLIGAALAHAGLSSLNLLSIIKKVVLPMVLSPLIGFGVAYCVMFVILLVFGNADRRRVVRTFKHMQKLSSAFMATSHGLNDAQKTMGVISLALLLFHQIDHIYVPFWVKLSCALAMGAGTALGGWKIIKTMGTKISNLEPTTGFSADVSSGLVITSASLFGMPISTTHTVTACIFGVSATKRLSNVRWEVAANLLVAWVTTIPAAGVIAAGSFYLLGLLGLDG